MNSNNSLIIEVQYFPPIEYFKQLFQFPHVVIEAHENYQKGSYRNRCHIANSTGIQVLSVPLRKGKNAKQPIREVAIAYDMDWQKQHWQSIRTAYGSAPFWEHYASQLEPLFFKKYDYLRIPCFSVQIIFFYIIRICDSRSNGTLLLQRIKTLRLFCRSRAIQNNVPVGFVFTMAFPSQTQWIV